MDLQALEKGYQTSLRSKPKVATPKKGPSGLAGFLVNSLPAITSGVGAVGGSFLAPGLGTIAGGAAGGGLGEFLKRKITGQKEDIGQIVTQGVEGGALAGIGGVARGIKTGAQALTKAGTTAAEKEVATTAEKKAGGSFMKNLTTQGQQAQGRVAGVSAGSKVAGKELVPQDTEKMLQTLKNEGVQTGNANNTLRDVVDKQKSYGQQIADHFKTHDAPLNTEDTKTIANNYITGLKTSDPAILKQAQIIADDLQKNVKSTKSLWEFRKTLDKRIPDTKFGDEATTAKVSALKDARQYITDELGSIPGAKNYHDLAEIKPFISAEAKRLNNPSGGIIGRLAASGPVQKAENTAGKVSEKIGKAGQKKTSSTLAGIPVGNSAERLALDDGVVVNVRAAGNRVVDRGDMVDIVSKDGSRTTLPREDFNSLGKTGTSANASQAAARIQEIDRTLELARKSGSVRANADLVKEKQALLESLQNKNSSKLAGAGAGDSPPPTGGLSEPTTFQAVDTMSAEATNPNFMQKIVGAAANPIANPGATAGAIVKQEAGRGFGIPAAVTNQAQGQQQQSTADINTADTLLNTSANNPDTSNDPFAPENVQANVQAILQQGGKQKDVADYLSNVEAYQKLTTPSTKALNATQQQQANNANSALQDIQSLSEMLSKDPSLALKSALPGGSITQRLAGTTDYEAARNNIVDVISRLRSGAAISASEEKLYKSLLPSAGDTQESANSKLQRLTNLFYGFANPNESSGSDVTDLLANSGN